MKKHISIVLLFIVAGHIAFARKESDTTSTLKDFNAVMSFAVQPYLFYTSTTSVHSELPAPPADTNAMLHSTFYKLNDDLYYGNEQEEVYLQDSLLIHINHPRKMIQINKLDVASKKKLDLLPLQKMNIQKMLREHYSISQQSGNNDTAVILIRQQEKPGMQNTIQMLLSYTKNKMQPCTIEVTVSVKQPITDEVISRLHMQGLDTTKVIQQTAGVHYLVMAQTASIRFLDIEISKEKAMQMPSWADRIAYDSIQKTFTAKGICQEYELVQTF